MPDPNFVASIYTNTGEIYSNWESVKVVRSYKDGISTFEFTCAENAYGYQNQGMALVPGVPCSIILAGHQVIAGNITTVTRSIDAHAHEVVVSGKSATMDVKDSSVIPQEGNFNGSTLQQVASQIMQPHNVNMIVDDPTGYADKPFQYLKEHYGETCGNFISRMAMMRGLFIGDDEYGNLVAHQIDPSQSSSASITEGVNLKRGSITCDNQTAWGVYAGVGTTPGSDQNFPPRAFAAQTTNADARPNRIKIIHAENAADTDDLQTRVQMEAALTAAYQVQGSVTVVGWLDSTGGALWKEGTTITLNSMSLAPQSGGIMNLAIQTVIFAQDGHSEGTTTTLELCLPEALTSAPTASVGDVTNSNGTDGTQPAQTIAPDTQGGQIGLIST